MKVPIFKIGGVSIKRGQRRRLEIPVARLPTGTALSLPVTVVRGKHPGPTIWLSAAIHGDEVNGTEIISQVVLSVDPKTLRGAIVSVPIVNVYGFVHASRYLPDGRDLNRSFPGSKVGSLASRLANLFWKEVVEHCEYGIDFHTAARNRNNLPHLRADLADPEALRLAKAFGAPLLYQAGRIEGSLRAEAYRKKIPILVFEGGESLRFDEPVIKIGVEGTQRVLASLGMIDGATVPDAESGSTARSASWLRATRSGILHLDTSLGDRVAKGQILARIVDPFSGRRRILRAPFDGLVFGQSVTPLIYQGDAIVHLARVTGSEPTAPTAKSAKATKPAQGPKRAKVAKSSQAAKGRAVPRAKAKGPQTKTKAKTKTKTKAKTKSRPKPRAKAAGSVKKKPGVPPA